MLGGYSLLWCVGFSLWGFSHCGAGLQAVWAQELQLQALEHKLDLRCLISPQLVRSSQIRANPCLLHWQAGSSSLGAQGSPRDIFEKSTQSNTYLLLLPQAGQVERSLRWCREQIK